MTDIGIALLLLVPIVIVIIILNNSNKQRKKKAQKKINAYIAEATRQTGITNYFRKQLTHQTVIMDERNKKLLIVEHKNDFPAKFSTKKNGGVVKYLDGNFSNV